MIELVLPLPPSMNHYWRHVGSKTLISGGGRKYRLAVAGVIAESGLKLITGAVAIKYIAYLPDWRRRDIDNLTKALFDAIGRAGLWQDDSFVCAGVFEKRRASDDIGRVIVQIKPLTTGVTVKAAGAWLE